MDTRIRVPPLARGWFGAEYGEQPPAAQPVSSPAVPSSWRLMVSGLPKQSPAPDLRCVEGSHESPGSNDDIPAQDSRIARAVWSDRTR